MARDAKQTLKFIQQTFAASTNQLATQNYGASSTPSNGALILATSAGTAGYWYSGQSVALNRSGFRTTSADQTLLVSGEVSALANDPAMTGNTEFDGAYVTLQYATAGPINTASMTPQIFVEAASDSGLGAAGTDWTVIGASVPFAPQTSYASKTPSQAISGGIVTYSAAHGFQNGQVIWVTSGTPAGTGFAINIPLFVTNATSLTHGISLVPGGPTNTGLSTSTAPTVHYAAVPRRVSIPIVPTAKPWIRLNVQFRPNSTTALAQFSGVWIDNAFLSIGRDSAAVI